MFSIPKPDHQSSFYTETRKWLAINGGYSSHIAWAGPVTPADRQPNRIQSKELQPVESNSAWPSALAAGQLREIFHEFSMSFGG